MNSIASIEEIQDALLEAFGPLRIVTVLREPLSEFNYGAKITGLSLEPDNRDHMIMEMKDWCRETFGAKAYAEYYGKHWRYTEGVFWFNTEKDRTLFLLRWQ